MVMPVYRIGTKDLLVYEVLENSCNESKKEFPGVKHVAELFLTNKNLDKIVDSKNPMFLKGELCGDKVTGERITILPDGEELEKPFPLFAPKLTIHDEKSTSHWDVIFQNPSGEMAYIYTKKKKQDSSQNKFKKVEEFDKCLPKLKRKLIENLTKDKMALPILILLKTKMRVGNEIYYKKNSHKGLTTLKKRDVKISGNKLTFDYIAKDGVPRKITEIFSPEIITEFKKIIKTKKADDFIFTKNSHPIKDIEFEKTFKKYCGISFYPHIIRSHYATMEALNFLEKNINPSLEDVKKFYNKVANELGHKKFSKKNGWQDSYQVTLHYYINPKIVEKITERIKNG